MDQEATRGNQSKRRVAIACQGGGSHTAFTAGVLQGLMEAMPEDVDVVALDDALKALAKIDARQSRVVELRFFAGLSLAEISEAMEIAPATVQRDWTAARAWLHREMSRDGRV